MFSGRSSKSKKSKPDDDLDINSIEMLFAELADEDDNELISMEGIGKLSEKLGIDPSTDVRILVIMWRLKAISKPSCITKSEFINGMKSIRKDSLKGLMDILPALDPGFLDRQEFRDFYKFVFQFSREGTHKTIEKDFILSLLPLVLDTNRAPHLNFFMDFLKQTSHQRITLDQWDSFLMFNFKVSIDFQGYDSESAWPLLLDEYVEWRKDQLKSSTTTTTTTNSSSSLKTK